MAPETAPKSHGSKELRPGTRGRRRRHRPSLELVLRRGQQQQEQLRLGPGAAILNVPENRAVLSRIERARELTSEQLLTIAAVYRDVPATAGMAYRLAASAMAMIASSRAINRAMGSISKTEVEWSWLGMW